MGIFRARTDTIGATRQKIGASFLSKTCPSKFNGLKQRFQSVAGIKKPWFLLRLCPTRAAHRLQLQLISALGNVTKAESHSLQNGKKNAPP